VNVNQPFCDLATFFASIRYLHIVPQFVREPDRSVGRANDPFGGDFLEQMAKTRGKYQHWRLQGAWQTEEQFSDGTLRLMGLLWVALDREGPLLLEEPELSLHPEIVRVLPQMLARVQRRTGRQIFLSTHSPELLRDEGIGLDEVLLLRPGTEGTEVSVASSQWLGAPNALLCFRVAVRAVEAWLLADRAEHAEEQREAPRVGARPQPAHECHQAPGADREVHRRVQHVDREQPEERALHHVEADRRRAGRQGVSRPGIRPGRPAPR